jgi:hypothetical protein
VLPGVSSSPGWVPPPRSEATCPPPGPASACWLHRPGTVRRSGIRHHRGLGEHAAGQASPARWPSTRWRCSTASRRAGWTAPAAGPGRRARGLGRRRLPDPEVEGRPRPARRRRRDRHRRRAHAAGQLRRAQGEGRSRVSPLAIPMLMPNGPAAAVGSSSAPGRRAHPDQRVRVRGRGDRLRPGHDPQRPGRRRRRRRHRGRHPPAADRRLRATCGAVHAQRRARAGLAVPTTRGATASSG